jgi:hypothetical protein
MLLPQATRIMVMVATALAQEAKHDPRAADPATDHPQAVAGAADSSAAEISSSVGGYVTKLLQQTEEKRNEERYVGELTARVLKELTREAPGGKKTKDWWKDKGLETFTSTLCSCHELILQKIAEHIVLDIVVCFRGELLGRYIGEEDGTDTSQKLEQYLAAGGGFDLSGFIFELKAKRQENYQDGGKI